MLKQTGKVFLGPVIVLMVTIGLMLTIIFVSFEPILQAIIGSVTFILTMVSFTYMTISYFKYTKNKREEIEFK